MPTFEKRTSIESEGFHHGYDVISTKDGGPDIDANLVPKEAWMKEPWPSDAPWLGPKGTFEIIVRFTPKVGE